MLSRITQNLRSAVQKLGRRRTLAGQDKHGNKYYFVEEARTEHQPQSFGNKNAEKRWVEFQGDPDPTSLPSEWRSWLSHSRVLPPSSQESAVIDEFRVTVKQRAKALEEEEERRRFRESSLREDHWYTGR